MTNSQSGNTVRQAAERYAQLREQREILDAQVKELREQEEEAKATLITEMSAAQMPSARFDGLGRFVIKQSVRYDITDIDVFVRAMLQRMVDNGKAGRPLSDGLMLQKRPSKTIIEELMESGYIKELAPFGLAQEEKLDLTFTKQK